MARHGQPELLLHADQLNRPVRMTDGAKATVWQADHLPFGVASISGSETLDARFPGQWFQLEAGLHYNWHRHYDPTLGRYTQPDPLGFVDGPSVFAYALGKPLLLVDKDGRLIGFTFGGGSAISGGGGSAGAGGGIDFTDGGKKRAFIYTGGGVGLDIGGDLGAGIFFGDWCQFSGTTYTLSISILGFSGSVFISGGRIGLSGAYSPGPVPAGTSFTITNTKVFGQ